MSIGNNTEYFDDNNILSYIKSENLTENKNKKHKEVDIITLLIFIVLKS